MPRYRLALPALLALALIINACGTAPSTDASADAGASQPAASQATEPDPAASEPAASAESDVPQAGTELTACEIVTVDDVAAATGIDVATIGQGELTESPTVLSPGHTECDYTGDWGGVTVSLTPEDGANLYDAARGSYDDASDRVITGSDGAFWSEENGRGFFWKGAVAVMLQVGFLAEGGDRDAIVTALGQAALDKVD